MIKFGPSGNSENFFSEGNKATVEMPKWLSAKNLEVFEYSFGRGVSLSEPTATAIKLEAEKYGIEITVHAPYYINLATDDAEKAENSFRYILQSLTALKWLGGNRCVVHCGTQGKMPRRDAVELIKERLAEFVRQKKAAGFDNLLICAETMGKQAQIGDVAEICEFCNIDDCIYPCIDFGHLNSRDGGSLKSPSDYERIIKYMEKHIGAEKTKNMHVHFSKIEYGQKGEIRHLTFEDRKYGPDFEDFAPVLVKYGLTPYCICESAGTQADDAVFMKNLYLAELAAAR